MKDIEAAVMDHERTSYFGKKKEDAVKRETEKKDGSDKRKEKGTRDGKAKIGNTLLTGNEIVSKEK